ncbi:protein kinase domain-containing protein, partial [Demequina mangrovi]
MRHVTPLRLDRVARAVGSGDRDERLARERVAALSELTHPGLCVPLDVVREDDAVVVCSPRVPGVTLEDAGRCADPGEWVWLVVGIAEALAALHASGLTHGDIAPANVMIARAPVLVDLVGPSLGHERGTPGFAAPERAAGGPPSAADDVHALGAVALAAAPEGFRSDAEAWMAPLLARDPSVRPAAAAVARGLVRCAEPQPWRPDAAVERESGSAVADARTQRAPGAW